MEIKHEQKDGSIGFGHRLVAPGRATGNWATYQLPAILKIKNVGTFVACTDYWQGVEPFPVPGKVYLVKEKTDK